MSTVYLAEHLLMNKRVAVKVLQTRLASDPKTVQRFQREAQAASSLSHPNLVTVHDFNVTADGQAYMVMDFLEGLSLDELISEDKPMPWREAILLLVDICDGVDHAHAKGIVHRDLKPANIMLLASLAPDRRYTPKIVDFGLAKVLDEAALHLTNTGEIFGSPLYMSPEQCQGQPVDTRSDIYSIGCILYATLAGRPPFQGAGVMQTLMMHINAPPPAVPPALGVPAWLEAIAHKAMSKNAELRFQSVADLARSLSNGNAGTVSP
jgi:serine/threonine-protein kinase